MRTVLITGTSAGFGLLAAVELAKRGWRVVASMRNLERRGALEPAEPRPLVGGKQKDQRDQQLQRAGREEEQRGEQRGDEDGRRAYACRKLTLQATSARLAASSCSLVRPKRRSRLQ